MAARELPDEAANDAGAADGHQRDPGFGALRSAVRHLLDERVTRACRCVLNFVLVSLPEPDEHRSGHERRTPNTDRDPGSRAGSYVLSERSFRLDSRRSLDGGLARLDLGFELGPPTRFDGFA